MRHVEGVMNGANRGLVGSSGLLWLLVRKALLFGRFNRRSPHAKNGLWCGHNCLSRKLAASLGFFVVLRLMHALSTTARSHQPGADDLRSHSRRAVPLLQM